MKQSIEVIIVHSWFRYECYDIRCCYSQEFKGSIERNLEFIEDDDKICPKCGSQGTYVLEERNRKEVAREGLTRQIQVRNMNYLIKYRQLPNRVYLYGLLDPFKKDIRYVGQTTNPFARLKQHTDHIFGWPNAKDRLRTWMSSLCSIEEKERLSPVMKILAVVESEMADQQEKALIQSYLRVGIDLYNIVRK